METQTHGEGKQSHMKSINNNKKPGSRNTRNIQIQRNGKTRQVTPVNIFIKSHIQTTGLFFKIHRKVSDPLNHHKPTLIPAALDASAAAFPQTLRCPAATKWIQMCWWKMCWWKMCCRKTHLQSFYPSYTLTQHYPKIHLSAITYISLFFCICTLLHCISSDLFIWHIFLLYPP